MITIFLLGLLTGVILTIILAFWLDNRMKKAMKSLPKPEAVIQQEAEEYVNIFLDYSKVRNN